MHTVFEGYGTTASERCYSSWVILCSLVFCTDFFFCSAEFLLHIFMHVKTSCIATQYIVACRPIAGLRNDAHCRGSGFLINGVTQPVAGWCEHIPLETVRIREWTVFSNVVCVEELSWRQFGWPSQLSVESQFCMGLCERGLELETEE
jgi:hypothetical protein